MTKRLNFQEILDHEFKWLRQEDRPFDDGPPDGPQLTENEHTRLEFMTEGYKLGADEMVSTALADKDIGDRLVYPILFNYRHFLELSLKRLIEDFGPYAGVEPEWKTHDLMDLWAMFEHVLDHFRVPDQDEADALTKRVISDFATADPKSFYHRYPFERDGKPVQLTLKNVDLEGLKDTMERVSNYFEACDAYWSTKLPVALFSDA